MCKDIVLLFLSQLITFKFYNIHTPYNLLLVNCTLTADEPSRTQVYTCMMNQDMHFYL